MSIIVGLQAATVIASAAPLVFPSVASAEPVWPVAGVESASDTIDDLEAQGYDVQVNWVSGLPSVPLNRCKVTAIHNANHSPPSEGTPLRRFTSTCRVQTPMTTGDGPASAAESASDRDSNPGQCEVDRLRVAGR